jgi:hypothetical protein
MPGPNPVVDRVIRFNVERRLGTMGAGSSMVEDPVQAARFAAANEIVGFLMPRVHSERISLPPTVASGAHAAARLVPPLDVADPRAKLTPSDVLSVIASLSTGQTRRVPPDQEAIPAVFYERLATDLDVLDFTRFEARNHLDMLMLNRRREPGTVLTFSRRLAQLTTCCAEIETVETKCRDFFRMVLKYPVPPLPDQVTSFIDMLTLARQLRMLRPMPLDPCFVVFDHPYMRSPGAWRDHLRVAQEDPPMTKVVLRRPPSSGGTLSAADQELLESLESRKAEIVAAEREAHAQREEVEGPVRETERALKLASFARGEYTGDAEVDGADPIGVRWRAITIDSEDWAARIIALAHAWKRHPGFTLLEERQVRGEGLGFEAGRHIFQRASEPTITTSELAAVIDGARTRLGVAQGDLNHPRSELGIWNYFRQMNEDFGRGYWRSPIATVSPPEVAGKPGATTAEPAGPAESERITIHVAPSTLRVHHPNNAVESLPRTVGIGQLCALLSSPNTNHDADAVIEFSRLDAPANSRSVDSDPAKDAQSAPKDERVADAGVVKGGLEALEELKRDLAAAKSGGDPVEIAEVEAEVRTAAQALGLTSHRGKTRRLDPGARQRHDSVRKNIKAALTTIETEAPLLFAMIDGCIDVRTGRLSFTPRPGTPPIDISY